MKTAYTDQFLTTFFYLTFLTQTNKKSNQNQWQNQALPMSNRDVSLDYQMKFGINLKACFEPALPYQEYLKPISNEHDIFTYILMGMHLTFISGCQELGKKTWKTHNKSYATAMQG